MTQRKTFGWLTFDMLVFAGINVFLIWHFQDRFFILDNLSYFKLIVLGLAAYRAANILSNEAVTKPIRAPFIEETQNEEGKIVEIPKRSGFTGAMGLLLYCPSCTGVWFSATIVYSYIFFPKPTFVVALFLALSAIERIIATVLGRIKAD